MTEAVRLPVNDALERARAAQAARENGIRAQAIQEGRKLERLQIEQAFGGKSIDEMLKYSVLSEAHASEIDRLDDRHAVVARHVASSARWSAAFVAGAVAAVAASCATAAAMSSGMFGYAAVTRAVNTPPYEPPPAPAPYTHAPEAGYDHNPINGHALHAPADAP